MPPPPPPARCSGDRKQVSAGKSRREDSWLKAPLSSRSYLTNRAASQPIRLKQRLLLISRFQIEAGVASDFLLPDSSSGCFHFLISRSDIPGLQRFALPKQTKSPVFLILPPSPAVRPAARPFILISSFSPPVHCSSKPAGNECFSWTS
ncbi:hypothetical protein KSP39_PZI003678 [Platanthera zijinensis]|uniref:Uncharacterized protein n=1 Tax=Platanthera zijinensis TaxID=2320716 RepID=A0AAP0BX37_9ASPA